jgi:hypothetical protein
MARPPQYERQEEPWIDARAVMAAIKRLQVRRSGSSSRWLCLYCADNGATFSPQISRGRERIAIDGVEYWLVGMRKVRS